MSQRPPRPFIGGLKKLLMCRRRRKSGARQSPTSSTESSRQVFGSGSAGGNSTCTADTPDWEQWCPPRPVLGLAAKRYKRSWKQLSVSTEYSRLEAQEDTDSVRTLGSGSVEIADTEALIESQATPGLKPEVDDEAAAGNIDEEVVRGCGPVVPEREETDATSGCLASSTIRHGSFGGCRAEICLLENCDHCSKVKSSSGEEAYVLAKPDDLVVTEYRVETCMSSNKRQSKVINNAPVNYQRHMKAELCEVNLPVESGLHSRSPDAIHMSTNVSNMTLPFCNEANHSAVGQQRHQTLTVRAQSDESEPRNTCATVTASGQVSSCELGDFNNNDTSRPTYVSATAVTEAITNAASSTADCPRSSGASLFGEARKKPAGVQSQPQQQRRQRSTFDGAAAIEQMNSSFRQPDHPSLPNCRDHLSRDRFGTLTGDQCSRLYQGLQGDNLLLQYMAKRYVNQATRERHRQRCARINAERVLRNSSSAAEATTAAGPAAAELAATTAAVTAAAMAPVVASSGDTAAPATAAASSAATGGRRRAAVPTAPTSASRSAVSASTTVTAADRPQYSHQDSNSQKLRRRAHISACSWSLHGLP